MSLENVTEKYIQGARVLVGGGSAKDVVAIEGSILGGPNHLGRDVEMGASLLAELLDAGTKQKDKETLREMLSARGAFLSFRASGDRTHFSAGCFPEDVSFTLSLLTECLAEASLKPKEVEAVRERLLGELEEERTRTKALSCALLSRLMYPKKHIQYEDTVTGKQAQVKRADKQALTLLQKGFGTEGMVIAITGDVDEAKAFTAARRALTSLPEKGLGSAQKWSGAWNYSPSSDFINVKDKANIDTYFGRPLTITTKSNEYLPFAVAASLLGGKGLSTGHLMRTIRERDGLTYGIYAVPGGFADGQEGSFRIWATFSPERYEHSVEATKKEITVFLKTGITEDVLRSKKVEMAGRYLIALSTTRGLAQALHQVALEERELSYLVEYPKLVGDVALGEVAEVAQLFDPALLSVAGSGTRSS